MEKLKLCLISICKFLKPYLKKLHKWRKRIWRKYQINKIILLVSLTFALISSAYLFYLAKTADVKTLKSSMSAHTVILDEFDQEVGSLYGQKGTYKKLSEISPKIQEAVISTEDRTFYENRGVDPMGILRAVFYGVVRRGISGGGSTITQQLAKNAYLTQRQTWDRKARELFLALEINKKYKKKDILAMYLNQSYFGNGIWGVEDAAHKYFGKCAAEVNTGEAAMLAGILKGPEIYNPINSLEKAKNRRDTVLQVMVDNEKLSQKEVDEEAKVSVESMLNDNYSASKDSYRYPSFFDAMISEAEKKADLSEKDILTKGYKIYTTLNQNHQKAMQSVYNEEWKFPHADDGKVVQSATVAMNPATGGVEALVGEVGDSSKHLFRGFNYATQSERSPGSSIKPLVVYTPAIQKGYKLDEMLPNSQEELKKISKIQGFDGAEKVTNYDQIFTGEVPMYQALARSLNVPAVYLESKVGLNCAFEMGERFGLPLQDKDKYYGLALGGLSQGVSPWIMAQAYGTFGNGGEMMQAHLIRKIIDSTGAVVYEANAESKSVISKGVAKKMTSMMLGTFSSGTGANAAPYGYRLAGKTGTTETDFDVSKTKDQWVIGYNPNLVIATWLGFETTDQAHYLDGSSTQQVSEIFRDVASEIFPNTSGKKFDDLYNGIQNAYAIAGEDMEDVEEESGTKDSKLKDLKKKSEEIWKKTEDSGKNIIDGVTDRVKNGWKKVKNFFGGN
ncbi:MAG: PBP1A family penicillin-binding protein [Lactobacillales bacterium]|jgi:penicillin-binding protein 2A|nr:PBP1A family penicillin-binding protein [Lactobacillales bacterium]